MLQNALDPKIQEGREERAGVLGFYQMRVMNLEQDLNMVRRDLAKAQEKNTELKMELMLARMQGSSGRKRKMSVEANKDDEYDVQIIMTPPKKKIQIPDEKNTSED